MASNAIVIGEKISQLQHSEEVLLDKDLFVFSHFKKQDDGLNYYDYTKSIYYYNLSSFLYGDIMPRILNDRDFINKFYPILSSRLLNDENFIDLLAKELSGKIGPVILNGIITYNSTYPQ